MKKHLFSILYLLALAFGTNVVAEEDKEPKKEEETVEGEVEEAKNGLELRETNSDQLFGGIIGTVLQTLLSKGGLPTSHAQKIAKDADDAVNKEGVAKDNVHGTVAKVVNDSLTAAGVPAAEAQATADHVAQKAQEAVQEESK